MSISTNKQQHTDSREAWRGNLLRGGRVAKYKGIAGGVAPHESTGSTFLTGLASTSLIALTAFFAAPSASLAGTCTTGPTSVCSGPADAADATQAITGTDVNVTTEAGFGLTVGGAGNAIAITSTGGASFTDTNASSITSGTAIGLDGYGVTVANSGSGDLIVNSNGHITGAYDAVSVTNNAGTGDVIINVNDLDGERRGIEAVNNGTGGMAITSTGTINSAWDGIYARTAAGSTGGIKIDVNEIHATGGGAYNGIYASNGGAGNIEIKASGLIESDGIGVNAVSGLGTTGVTIDVQDVKAGGIGINLPGNAGTGDVTVKANNIESGSTGINFDNGPLTNNFTVDVNKIDSGLDGINGYASGTGNVEINVGSIEADRIGVWMDIDASPNAGTTTLNIGDITAGDQGINIDTNANTSGLEINVNNMTTGSHGIYVTHRGTGTVDITSSGLIDAGGSGIIAAGTASSTGTNIDAQDIKAGIFGIDLTGNAGTGDITVSANTIDSGSTGINFDTGPLTSNFKVDVNKIVSGLDGMYGFASGDGDVNINVGAIDAARNGIWMDVDASPNAGKTTLNIGDITAGNEGINIETNANTSGLEINVNDVNSGASGIRFNHFGSGDTIVNANDITTKTGHGIWFNTYGTGDVNIAAHDIDTAGIGIWFDTYFSTKNLNVDVNNITSGSDGINAIHSGTGVATITSTGTIKSGGVGIDFLNDSASFGAAPDAQNIITVNNIDTANNVAINVVSNAAKGTVITTNGAINTPAAGPLGGDGIRVVEHKGPLVVNVAASSTITSYNNTMDLTNNSDAGTTVNVDGTLKSTASLPAYDGVIWVYGTPGTTTVNLNDGSTVQAATKAGFAITDNGGDSVVNVGKSTVTGGFRLGAGDDKFTFNGTDMTNVGTLDGGAGSTGGDVLTLNSVSNFTRNLQTETQEIRNWDAVNLNGGTADLVGTLTTDVFTVGKDSAGNPAVLSIGADNAGNTLTTTGNYVGAGGTIVVDTVLGGDTSATDVFKVGGSTSGSTDLRVNNLGGTGAPTVEGIKVIDVTGASNGTFTLVGGDYALNNQQVKVVGAYGYTLWKNGVSTPTDGDWYLRSQIAPVAPVDPSNPSNPGNPGEPTNPGTAVPLYSAAVPTAEAYAQALLGLNGVSSLQQRVGNRVWAGNGNKVVAQGADPVGTPYAAPEEAGVAVEGNGVWGRIEGAHNSITPRSSTSNTEYDQNIFKLQAGIDGLLAETETGKLIGGITVHYAHGKTDIDSLSGDGKISTDGYGFGGTLTWYGENGFYLDGQGQVTWYKSDLDALLVNANIDNGNKGFGYTLSLEGGKRIAIDPTWSVTPQAQLVYSNVDFDAFNDMFGSRVSLDRGESLQGRLGLTLDHQTSWQNANGSLDRANVYGIANLYYEFLEGTRVDFAGTSVASEQERLWGGLGVGGSYNWNDDKFSIFGEGLVNTSLNNFGDSYSVKGNVGFRVKW